MPDIPANPSLTVDSLLAHLQELSTRGLGTQKLAIPYRSAIATVGGRPSTPVAALNTGFDWDHGTVFLEPQHELGERTAQVTEMGQRHDKMAGRMFKAWSTLSRARESGATLDASQLDVLLGLLDPRKKD